jgi:RHS repeat-associated protein
MRTPLRTYYHGPQGLAAMIDHASGQRRTFHYDHQGTVQCLTDGTGQVTDRFAANAWGVQVKRTGTGINRHWYIGRSGYYRQVDQALDYVRARWLDVAAAGWLSVDPLMPDVRPGYKYAENQPSLARDPSGLLSIMPIPDSCRTLGDCGSAVFSVAWAPPAGRSGWVIQRVIVAGSVNDCADPPQRVETRPPIGFEYWEAWPVRNGVVGACNGNIFVPVPPAGPHDVFLLPDNPSTRGAWGLHGYVKFYPRPTVVCGPTPNLPGAGHWLPPPCRIVPFWHINLHCALTRPPGVDDKNEKQHFMVAKWDCCPPGCPPAPPINAQVVCHP